MHAKSGGSSGEPPDFLFIPAACRSRKDLPRSAGGGDRARNAGYRLRNAEDGGTGTGAGRGRRGHGHGHGHGRRHGRRTQNAEHVYADADAGTGTGTGARGAGRRTQNAERRTQNTGYWPRAAEHGKRGHEVQKTEDAGTGCRTQNTGYWPRAAEHGKRGHGAQETGHKPPCMERNATAYAPPGPATTGLDRSQPGAIRRRDQSAGTFHGWTPAAGTRNNPPGPFTAGRHPPPGPATTRRGRSQPGAIRRGPHPTCRAYESESRRCRRARRTCCCRAAPRPT